jgi:hypothetical protein
MSANTKTGELKNSMLHDTYHVLTHALTQIGFIAICLGAVWMIKKQFDAAEKRK